MKNSYKIESVDFCMLDYKCPYLKDRKTRMYYKFIPNASKELCSLLIARGWRRFGYSYFHPICKDCNECKSLRIDVRNFKYSRSQKRTIKRNSDTYIAIQKPSVSYSHIELYNKFHQYKSKKDDWPYHKIDIQSYYEEFVQGAYDYGKEVLYFKDKKLIGVDLIDIVDDGISSIYFFYDPDYSHLSLGVYSLLVQIDLAKKMGLKWIYLGYWVEGCKSFAYKTNFKPYQLLDGFPPLDKEPEWK
ncbi:arginyltransferase [Nitrosophilus alvini]|uniref:arginyltransferase n=1 Tax=Nitrosophilus alvini TaxID=2714855 RepID=UPI00190A712C|nr:arginyltransferase [Nitrosophilus alvini]